MKLSASAIAEWLKKKLQDQYKNPLWLENEYAFGDSEIGFSSSYEINFEALGVEMDKWIKETFGEQR